MGEKHLQGFFFRFNKSLMTLPETQDFQINAALISISNMLFFNEGIYLYAIQLSFYQQSIDYNDPYIYSERATMRSQSFSTFRPVSSQTF